MTKPPDPIASFIHDATDLAICVGTFLAFTEADSIRDQLDDQRLRLAASDALEHVRIAYQRLQDGVREREAARAGVRHG